MLDNSTDLTGYMIWPASGVLAQFIAAPFGSQLLEHKKVIELGTGAGLIKTNNLYCSLLLLFRSHWTLLRSIRFLDDTLRQQRRRWAEKDTLHLISLVSFR